MPGRSTTRPPTRCFGGQLVRRHLILTGDNNFTGGTTVSNGMLQAANAGALPGYNVALTSTSGVSVGSGATLAINVGNPSSHWLSAQVDGLVGNAAFAPATLGFDTTNGNFSYSTNLTGNMSVAKFGPNTLTLSGDNSYGGTTTVNAGALQAANAGDCRVTPPAGRLPLSAAPL